MRNYFSFDLCIISTAYHDTHRLLAVSEPVQQQPDGVFVLTQPHSVEGVKSSTRAALQPELCPQSCLQEIVLPDVPGEERDGERHHGPALQQRLGLVL